MKYSKYSLKTITSKKFTTDWSFKEGVFKTPSGDFIARIKKMNTNLYKTISRHKTYNEAKLAIDFYKNEESELK